MEEGDASISSQIAKMLKPIRELASNWDIDIACELEDYLKKLSQLDLSAHGVHINFAEAALLIQGSAAVYSKKVEYLYSILLRTLDHVSQQETQKSNKKIKEDGKDDDGYEEEPLEFLSLDDIVEENMAGNIDLDEDLEAETEAKTEPKSQNASNQQKAALRFALTLGNSSSMNVQATSLDTPSIDNPRINGSDFRMNSCFLDASGALILGSSMELLSQSMSSAFKTNSVLSTGAESGNIENIDHFDNFPSSDWNGPFKDGNQDDSFSDTGADVGGLYDPVPLFAQPEPTKISETTETALRGPKVGGVLNADDAQLLETLVDPWVLHDPHDPGSVPAKPFAKGLPFRLPKKVPISVPKSKPVVRLAGLVMEESSTVLAKPCLAEFSYIYDEEMKKIAAQRLSKRKTLLLAQAEKRGVHLEPTGLKMLEETQPKLAKTTEEEEDEESDEELKVKFGQSASAPAAAAAAALAQVAFTKNNDFKHYGNDSDSDEEDEGNTKFFENHKPGMVTYEEHCKMRLEEYFRAAQQYVHETELSARLDLWSAKLTPLLLDQEARPSFDIHFYGNKLIDRLKPVDQSFDEAHPVSKEFSSLFIDQPSYEVSRTFSSMLQLANMGNVRIERSRNQQGLHDITVVLLSTAPAVDIDSLAVPQQSNSMELTEEVEMTEKRPAKAKRTKAKVTSSMDVDEIETTTNRKSAKKASKAQDSDFDPLEAPKKPRRNR